MKKVMGIKKAVGEFNNWQGAARIYFDKVENKVWTDVFTAPGWWTEYHDADVVEVFSKSTWRMDERDDTITMAALRERCQEVLA